ncbi:TPA: GNAT family N-acetyltransferase [Vibrio parahaemolyticus]|uniref:GNAT family N-acetyltransferase n=1 Tax=Vibrio harveyi group TaxID=717610 RepID=UPI00157399E3|nr:MULTISPECIES: N-acetyltransferase [Vibrio harveyi group]EHR5317503.1 N-acetyltransferase [Vibrio parahaemolyticus]EHR5462347.1 N-acetyltransferase [Vibrio parahaemolyticus]MBD6969514.1 N-acetyltransferase [Vibrio parahaemolyticus]MBD6974260.1 N-acetyltransferase [Vibrio parahaemolyticus]MCC3799488.1 N-acetyltransferase [Vibrio parahaemolyticus]
MKYALYKQEQIQEVITLFKDTFSDSEGKEEGALIAKLVEDFLTLPTKDEDLYVFIAQDESERIVGSIIFSRLSFPNGESIFLLAPVAVATDCHGKGIGQNLIQFGLDTLKEKGVTVAITYGDINFYSKTGFAPISQDLIQAPLELSYPEGWIAQSLVDEAITKVTGKPTCLKAIDSPNYW